MLLDYGVLCSKLCTSALTVPYKQIYFPTGCRPPPPSSMRGKTGRNHLNEESPPPPHWDRRAIQPNHIEFKTCSALAPMWTPPINESAKLTRGALYSELSTPLAPPAFPLPTSVSWLLTALFWKFWLLSETTPVLYLPLCPRISSIF
jgi:hypothetical protein